MMKKIVFCIFTLFLFVKSTRAQEGKNINDPIQISLPFSLQNISTCGFGNDYQTYGNEKVYAGGEDIVYSFRAEANGKSKITLTGGNYSSIFITTGDPLINANIVAASLNNGSLSNAILLDVMKGKQYYIFIDNWPSPDCNNNLKLEGTLPSPFSPIPNNQDCLDAIPVCASTYSNPVSYSGTGNIPDEIDAISSCLKAGERNDVWYQFTVQSSGDLCFCIDPVSDADDYDWALFNLTNANCTDIATDPSLEVACNYSSSTGWISGAPPSWVSSGAMDGNTGLFPSGSTYQANSQINTCVTVSAGESYVLNVSNYSGTGNGYTLYFPPPSTAGMAQIFDNVSPSLQVISATPGCGGTTLDYNFSENLLCATVSTGDFTLTGPGGPYSVIGVNGAACVAGAPGENTFTATFTPAITQSGNYQFCLVGTSGSVTDLCGNAAIPKCLSFTVAGPTLSTSAVNVSCFGGNTGSITATGSGGSGAPYTYSLNSGAYQASGNFGSLTAGTYTVTVKDAGGCSKQSTVAITQPSVLSISATPTNATCAGNNGSISTTVAGGTTTYSYSWSPSGAGASPSNLSPGTYSVAVTDARGCTATTTALIALSGGVTSTFNGVSNVCLNGNNLNLINTGSAGAGITYSWTFAPAAGAPATSTALDYTAASFTTVGTYTITHTVTQGICTSTTTRNITIFANPPAPTATTTNATCTNSDGSVHLTSPLGAGYQYMLGGSAYQNGVVFNSIAAGTLNLTVQNSDGCTAVSPITVNQTTVPTAVAITSTNSTCGNSNGTLTIGAVTGGISPYTYSINGGSFSSTLTYTGQAASSHTIVVKDANGCQYSQTAVIANTNGPTALTTAATNATCGNTNGLVNIGAVTGGTSPYLFSFNAGAYAVTTNYTSLAPGAYNITVKDANNCLYTTSVNIVNVAGPTAVVLTAGNATCGNNNGTITIGAVTGGTNAFNYSLDGGTYSATTSYTGLTATTHTIIVKDANNCLYTQNITLSNIQGSTALATTTVNAICGGNNGTVNLGTVTGGTPPYSYSFNGGAFSGITSYSNLAAGVYAIILQDANGCTFNTTASVSNSGGPTNLVVSSTKTFCSSNTGVVTIGAVTGGSSPYSYSFNGSPYTTTTVYSNVGTGTYNAIVKDNNGCQYASTVTVDVTDAPTAVAITTTNSTCGNANGTLTIVAVTGTNPPYTYSVNASSYTGTLTYTLLSATIHTVAVKDANGCVFSTTATIANSPGPTAVTTTTSNTTCGNTNGIITIGAITGGIAAYTYAVDGSAFSASTTLSGLSAATHTLVVKDANGCLFTKNLTIANTTGPTDFSSNTTQTACNPGTGTITVSSIIGGTSPYTYSYNNGTTYNIAATGTGLVAGTHTVVVKDANGCTYSETAVITTVASPTDLTFATTDATCGLNNGVIIATGVGGATPYTYSVNAGASQASGSFLTLAGSSTYTVTLTDNNGCTYSETTTIGSISVGIPSVTNQSDVKCFGGSDGNFTIGMAGGSSPYTYTISPGGSHNSTGAFSGLSTGTYTVSIVDASGCHTSQTLTINQPSQLTLSVNSNTAVLCNGGSNGAIAVTGLGGSTPYQYSINGGIYTTSNSFSSLSAGTYTVQVRDNGGCTALQNIAISQPNVLTLSINSIVNANCTASNGTANVLVTGGTPGYTYSWSGGGGTNSTTIGLPSGIYTVTVTDQHNCTQTTTATIGTISGGTATMSVVKNISCSGLNDGSLTVSMNGNSTAPFTYIWTPGVGTTATINNLVPGLYSVKIIDKFGCTSITSATIAEPLPISLSLTSNNVSCNAGHDGTITANASGGTGTLNYLWNPGVFTTSTINNLPIGTYTVTVTDANSCVATTNRTIAEPTALTITSTYSNPHCGQADGSLTVTGAGGAGVYTYSINAGPFQSSGNFTNKLAGTYTITVKDANQCTQNFPVQLTDQTGPSVTLISKTDVKCFGGNNGTITVSASGGASPYTYAWNTSPVQSTPTATNLQQGIYSVNVTDANGCVASIGATINQPVDLVVNTVVTDPVCNGQNTGTATASAFGGTPNYTYLWSSVPAQATAVANSLGSGFYNVLVKDGNGCSKVVGVTLTDPPQMLVTISKTDLNCYNNCSGKATAVVTNGTAPFYFSWNDPNHQSTASAAGLCANNYTIQVTDYNGCIAKASINITQPTVLTTNVSNQVNIDCNGNCNGSGQISANGGTPPYTYSWSNGAGSSIQNGLCAGTYTVTVTDSKLCTSSQPITISQPPNLTLAINSTDASCYNVCDGTATANFSGGTAPYNFLWQPSLSTSYSAVSLCAGSHSVTLTDGNGCVVNGTTTIAQPNPLQVSTTVSPSNCLQSNGSACVQVNGGTSPFTYLWSNGSIFACNNNINGNVYTVEVKDAKGCVVQTAANVNDINGPTVTLNAKTDITCFGLNNGSATVTVAGGTPPYSSTTWLLPNLNANLNQNGTGLYVGNNSVKVVDAAGCVSSLTVPIIEPPQLVSASNNINNVTCNPANGYSCNGNATILVGGGTPPYTYIWAGTSNQTSATAVSLCAGTYTCTATDANGCTTAKPVTITQPLPLVIVTNTVTNINCYGYKNGQINTSPTGGTPPYTYTWSPNVGNSPVVTNLAPQLYNLLLTDAHGCIAASAYNIQQPDSFKIVSNISPSTCSQPNGTVSVAVTGGTPLYSYHWNDPMGQTTPVATGLSAPAPYTCLVSDSKGCSKTATINLTNLPGPSIDSTVAVHVSCNGFNNGSATVFPKNGTGPFTYSWTNSTGTIIGSGIGVSGLVAGNYNILVTDINNCTVSTSVPIIEPQLLTVVASQSTTVCNGQILGVYAAAGGGTPPYIYTWSGTGSTIIGGGNHNITFNNTSTTAQAVNSYSVSVTDAHNCPALSTQLTINVLPKLFPVVTNPTFGCDAQLVDIIAGATGGKGAPYKFLWSNGQTYSGTKDTITVLVQSTTPSTYTVTISDGCSTPEDTAINVMFFPKPAADIIALDKVGCSSLAVNFNGSAGGTAFAGSTFNWSFGDGDTSNLQNPIHIYNNNTMVTDSLDVQLIVTSAKGCRDTIKNNNFVVVYPKPLATFTTDPSSTTILYPEVNILNHSYGAIAYYWDFGDPNSTSNGANNSILTNPSHSYVLEGDYLITLTAVSSQACIDTATLWIHVDSDYALYMPSAFTPNGDGKNELFLPASVGVNQDKYHLWIYDRWGSLIFETDKLDSGWDGKLRSGEEAAEGLYIWKLRASDKFDNIYNLNGSVTVIR